MKNMIKTLIVTSIALCLLMCLFSVSAFAEESGYVLSKDKQETNIKWTIEDRILTFEIDPNATDKISSTTLDVNPITGASMGYGSKVDEFQNITKCIIGDGITSATRILSNIPTLLEVELPTSLVKISALFEQSKALHTVYVKGTAPIKNHADLSYITSLGSCNFNASGPIYTVSFSDDLTGTIPQETFQWNGKITELTIPAGVSKIGAKAFANCNGINVMTVLGKETQIDTNAFPWASYKAKITEIEYKANASVWASGVFADHKAVRRVTMPSTVTAWGNRVFSYASNLTTIAVEGDDLGENTLNFKYLTRILNDAAYAAQFEGCFRGDIDYKVYLSNDFKFTSNSNIYGFATSAWGKPSETNTCRLDSGDVFYVPSDYPDLANLSSVASTYGFTVAFYPSEDGSVETGTTYAGFKWTVTGDDTDGYVLTISDTEVSKTLDVLTFPSAKPWSGTYSFSKVVIEADVKTLGSSDGLLNVCKAPVLVIPASVTKLVNNIYSWHTKLHSILVLGETYGEELGDCIVDFRNLTAFPTYLEYSFDYSKDITFLLSNNITSIGNFSKFATVHSQYQTDNLGNGYHIGEGDVFYVYSDWDESLRAQLDENAEKIGFAVKEYPKAETAMEMYGYQVRTEGYNGLRGIFNFNENAKNAGFTLVEYGAILAADKNRGTDDANIQLSYNEKTKSYEPAGEKIIKKAIKQNGAWAKDVKILNKLNGAAVEEIKGANYTWFATTVVNFTSNYKDDIYMCGYEIWKNDLTGDIEIVYTGYANTAYEATNIYDVSVEMLASGVTNDLESNPIGVVVKGAGAVTLTADSATLPAGVTELTAENIEMKGYKDGAFTDGTTYYSLYEMTDGNYLAYISGTGNFTAAALKTTFASDYAGDSRPVPTLLEATHNKITHIVIGEGIADISSFSSMKKVKVIIYPKSLTSMSKANNYNLFASCTALGKIVPVGTVTDEKIFELSGLDQIGSNNNLQWTFQYCSSVEYIHLPGHSGGDSSFNGCSSLKAIWIGDDARPNDGFADLRSGKASTVYKSAFAGASGIHTLLLSDSTTRLAQETADFSSITTVYQATATAAANHCGSTATYTQTLPQGLYGTTEE